MTILRPRLTLALAAALLAPAALLAQTSDAERVGIVVMAHGGDERWNEAVRASVAPLAADVPTAIAFGMADPHTLSHALDSLRAEGVERVAVVRMFVSGESFLAQTEYLLGLSDEPPAFFMVGHGVHRPAPGEALEALDHGLEVATHEDGLIDSEEALRVLRARASALSVEPRDETVLLLAHGMADQAENDRLLEAMEVVERGISRDGFHDVHSETLREDWPEARAIAEAEIRDFVSREGAEGRRVLVVPVRLSGFGPYAETLDGLEYVAGEGLLPDESITEWIRYRACAILCARGWGSPWMAMGPEGRGAGAHAH